MSNVLTPTTSDLLYASSLRAQAAQHDREAEQVAGLRVSLRQGRADVYSTVPGCASTLAILSAQERLLRELAQVRRTLAHVHDGDEPPESALRA